MENEVKEVVYIAIAAMVLSLVLGLASFTMHIRDDLAGIRNEQIIANQQVKQYNEYNKYNKNTLIGDEVAECIRLHYDSGIDIFVDSRTNIDSGETINTSNGCQGSEDDHRIFNLSQYAKHAGSTNDYFQVSITEIERPKNDLRSWFPTSAKYRAYLVYNSESVVDFYERLIESFDTHPGLVTGDAATDLLDSLAPQQMANSEVTGIVFINLNTYGGN